MEIIIKATLKFLREADLVLLVFGIISTIYGVFLISSVTRNMPGTYISVQIGAFVIGIMLFVLFSYVDIDIIADKSWFLFAFSILFISSLFVWGEGDLVRRRAWIRLGEISIQPAEIVKVTFIIIMARMIVTNKERKTLNSVVSILQIMAVFGVIFGFVLVVSQDIGTAMVYFAILIIMLFIGGLKLRWFAIGFVILAVASPLIWINFFAEHMQDRILAPFFPDLVPEERLAAVLWQPDLSVRAISSGGFLGQGFGNGHLTQMHPGIFAQHTDFIFSAAGEELGFVGCMLIVILLVTIISRCVYIGVKSNNPLGLLVCTGVAAKLIAQMIENLGMNLGVMPVIGITLPFFSYGGSSLVTCFAALGIVSGIKMRPKPLRFRSL